mmetsp:Transcript_41390/g.99139  ORF Transcript_41390/g.99139 Transcript_41390/m.99139 type:complete len:144 (-) Transcript_41390:1288-1719(-)
MVFDIDAYSKSKGIPRGVISSETIKKVEAMADESKKSSSSSSAYNTFAEMCNSTQSALDACVGEKKSGGEFPAACTDLGVGHMKCLIEKRDVAMQTAIKLAGKDAAEKVFPYYEENKKKALELVDLYQGNVAGDKLKKDVFWG